MCNPPDVVTAVVPTVAVPLATIMFLINALVSWVASLFGLKLNWEGPRELLRALLRPRVVAAVVLVNLVTMGLVYAWRQSRTMPSPLMEVTWVNARLQKEWGSVGAGRSYADSTGRVTEAADPVGGAQVQSVAFRQLWRVKAGRGTMGAATVAGSSVFVGSVDGYVYEFDGGDGKLLRRFFVGTEISPDPVVWKSRLFVGEGTHDMHRARVYSFDLTTGRFVGAVQTKGHTEGTPAVVHDDNTGRDHLLFAAGPDGVYSVDPLTLEQQWHFVGGHTDSDPRALGGRVYFSTGMEKDVPGTSHFAYALDLATGATIWRTETPASGWMPGVFVDHEICFGVGELYAKSSFGQVSCYDIDSGRAGWVASADAPVLSVPLRLGRELVVADRDGEVCGLRLPEGRRAWCRATHAEANASVSYLAPGALIYPSAAEGLLALDPENGRTLAVWKPGPGEGEWAKTNARATLARDGSSFYLTDVSGNLRKIEARVERPDFVTRAAVGLSP
jgi:outer membrane protein assembly factor BamB